MSYLSHLITDADAPVTLEFARQVEATKRATPAAVRRAVPGQAPSTPAEAPKPSTPRATSSGKGEVSPIIAEAWAAHVASGVGPVTAAIRQLARTYLEVSRADFIATLVSLGVHPSTAGIQFKKGRG